MPHRQVCSRHWTWSFWPKSRKFAVECDWISEESRKFQKLVFFWKHRWVFGKKTLKIFIMIKVANLIRLRIKWYYVVKLSFPPYLLAFLTGKQKILNVGKVKKFEESVFSRKKRFHLLDCLPCKNGKEQNKPVLAGCLVSVIIYLEPSICYECLRLSHNSFDYMIVFFSSFCWSEELVKSYTFQGCFKSSRVSDIVTYLIVIFSPVSQWMKLEYKFFSMKCLLHRLIVQGPAIE